MVRVAILLACAVLTSCSRSPSAPSAPGTPLAFANYDGFWQGQFRYTDCRARHCLGQTFGFVLNLKQTGSSVRGLLVTRSLVAELTGGVATSGELQMMGTTPAASDMDDVGIVHVTRLGLRLEGERLAGSIQYSTTPAPASFVARFYEVSGPMAAAADVVTGSRMSSPSFSAAGRWLGWWVLRDCSAEGAPRCARDVGELGSIELTLEQHGHDVTGEFGRGLPVRGSVSGGTLTLEGFGATDAFNEARLSAFSARIDEFGRLKGTFTYTSTSRSPLAVITTVSFGELWQVLSYRPEM